ncbi:hypothetical protein GOBAR_AA09186 [Gossypium barbadense]|uniref:CASP-like protein n=1 Tax=Gossypium barbadense TaxID=3634 RepID=A0A2P5Y784_GOSBA|nr:hypothetical protein GOBAR_AA09186 [Gossypium barbadense]
MSLGVEFYSYSAFCYLVTTMGLVIPWSCTLAVLDGYSVVVKCPVHQPGILFIIAAGDWDEFSGGMRAVQSAENFQNKMANGRGAWLFRHQCWLQEIGYEWAIDMSVFERLRFLCKERMVLSVLTLAAACSTASVVDLLFQTSGSFCTPKCCGRYQLSAAMAFLTWFLSLASALLNLWLLPSSLLGEHHHAETKGRGELGVRVKLKRVAISSSFFFFLSEASFRSN